MNTKGMEQLSIVNDLTATKPTAQRRLSKEIGTGLVLTASAVLLSACSGISKETSPQSRYLYDAPAQAYSIDLGAQNFRGQVRLRDSCTPEGSSLNIYDNGGRFFRIDAVNLINNPNIQLPDFADDTTTRDVIFRYYMEKVNPNGTIIIQRNVDSRMGSAMYAVVEYDIAVKDPTKELNTTRYMGYLISRRGNFGYVLQHEEKFYRADRMLEILGLMASEIQIPGRLPTNKKQSDNPLYIDLKNSTPAQIEEWKKAALCGYNHSIVEKSESKKNHSGWFDFLRSKPKAETPVDYSLPQADSPDTTSSPSSTSSDTTAAKPSLFHRTLNALKFW